MEGALSNEPHTLQNEPCSFPPSPSQSGGAWGLHSCRAMATLGLGGHAGVADTADVLPRVCSDPREGQAGRVRAGVHLHGAWWDCWVGGLLLGHRHHPGAGWWQRDSLISTQKAQRCSVLGKKTVIPAITMTFSGENSSQIVCVTLQSSHKCVCMCLCK